VGGTDLGQWLVSNGLDWPRGSGKIRLFTLELTKGEIAIGALRSAKYRVAIHLCARGRRENSPVKPRRRLRSNVSCSLQAQGNWPFALWNVRSRGASSTGRCNT
jgi:hypothetical protein